MENEVWKDIQGYEGLYTVSNYGRVKSLNYRRTGNEMILKDRGAGKCSAYRCVVLTKERVRTSLFVHSLVAFAFPEICGEWFPGAVVNHKDCNPSNNNANNLEWVTQKYNVNYKNAQVKRVMTRYPRVLQYDTNGNFIDRWLSSYEVERVKGWSSSSITACARGELKVSHGFIWRYEE